MARGTGLRSPQIETLALIVAGGRGQRLGGDVPKQYRALAGRPVIAHTVARFADHAAVDHVQVVIHRDDAEMYVRATAAFALPRPVMGGASRQASVCAGLEAWEGRGPDRVLIHDAVRPMASATLIGRVLAALDDASGAIAALPVTDTLKREADGRIAATVPRSGLWRAQTPQGFHFAQLLDAHRAAAGDDFTDDAAVAEAAGIDIALVSGEADNLKITTADDLARAERLLSDPGDIRVGSGFDVHRFGPGDHVMLCGGAIAHDHGLIGHSDADVGLHAATDAILGALSDGDIGAHFPSGDPQWKDAPSYAFLRFASERLAQRGGALLHLDVTLICQRPAIAPHRAAMVARLAELLTVPATRISVKATTTDGLGFAGRGEGIAGQAVATVRLPPL